MVTESRLEGLQGHRAMMAWNPTWKSRHMPDWARRTIRAHMRDLEVTHIEPGDWIGSTMRDGGAFRIDGIWYEHGPSGIFDHWGSIQEGPNHKRELVMCPYARDDHAAEILAKKIGASGWMVAPRGPWHPSTFLYIFHP